MVFTFALGNVFAQEEKGRERKDFSEILPQSGDIALGLDLANFIKTINNSVTNPTTGPTVKAFQSDFFAKYFVSNKGAIRARLGILINNYTDREFVRDDNAYFLNPISQGNPLLEKLTVDVYKSRFTNLELGIGYEFRRSLWRVQGYVGMEVFGGMTLARERLEYGNPMTKENQNPSIGYSDTLKGYRMLESKSNGFTCGAAAFIGADLFLCRNVSIGAEFYFEGRYNHWGERVAKSETWLLEQAYVAEEYLKPITSSFKLTPMGRLNLMIYF